jgi:two-component system phosphate regulon sensor histidine kinase PhoR
MKSDRKQLMAMVLMITSLVFLAGFLILFLVNNYKQEKGGLEKEVGYLFVNSIRKIEGGILNKIAMEVENPEKHPINIARHKKDSLHVKSIIRFHDEDLAMKEENFEIKIRKDSKVEGINQMEGSVAMFIAISNDSTATHDSCINLKWNGDFLKELEENFRENISAAKLPVSYSIRKESAEAKLNKVKSSVGSYTDVSSGVRYTVDIDGYGFLIFKKILPEMLFSILLFLCVALAFFMVNRSLNSERNLLNLKNDFIQNITHELKTPIATVSVAIEALQDFNVLKNPEKSAEYIDISKNELKRLSLLVDKVLNISSLDNEIPAIKLEPLDLRGIIEQILNTLKLQFEKMNVAINFESIGQEFIVMGDRQHLDVLLYNLLDNAIKYNNSSEPKIDIQLTKLDDKIKLVVSDNGIGIPQEHQKNVFDKFYRVPQGNIHNVKGHGLGLSFVSQVVKEMHGEIKLESEQTVGSTFIIEIPAYSQKHKTA